MAVEPWAGAEEGSWSRTGSTDAGALESLGGTEGGGLRPPPRPIGLLVHVEAAGAQRAPTRRKGLCQVTVSPAGQELREPTEIMAGWIPTEAGFCACCPDLGTRSQTVSSRTRQGLP